LSFEGHVDDMLKELQATFLGEGHAILEELESALLELDGGASGPELMNRLFRLAHNFKGSSRAVGFTAVADLAHKLEDLLTALKSGALALQPTIVTAMLGARDALRRGLDAAAAGDDETAALTAAAAALAAVSGAPAAAPPHDGGFGFFDDEPTKTPPPAPTVAAKPAVAPPAASAASRATPAQPEELLRIPAARLDALLNLVGELVVNRTILDEHRMRGTVASPPALQTLAYISKLITDVQQIALGLRLVEVRPLLQKLRRTARDVAAQLGRDVEFVAEGEHVELDKSVLDGISDPLTHMVRNAVDHGCDTPEEREKAGKPPTAKVRVAAVEQEDRVAITIEDDGRGLDRERILRKAVERGLVSPGAPLSDQQIHALIFHPGFSTKDAVSDISGRGVGMEVVQRAIDDLKGTIEIESSPGKGSRFVITLPLSLSIIGGMVVEAGSRRFVLPVSQLSETIDLSKLRIETSAAAGPMINLRGEVVPVYSLAALLRLPPTPGGASGRKRPAILAVHRGRKVSFEVDAILSQQHVVLKRLGRPFRGLPGVMAGAILSDGEPGLVLNLHELIPTGGRDAA
jgi:two-component system chemotaxis sensor kinase CheA